jgi:hypothetical protein
MQLTEKDVADLDKLRLKLSGFKGRYLGYRARVEEILLSREILLNPERPNRIDRRRAHLAFTMMSMGRMTECETILNNAIVELETFNPGDPRAAEFRSILS